MTEKKAEAWGGEIHVPRWLQRLRRKPEATDTLEKLAETHKGKVDPPGAPRSRTPTRWSRAGSATCRSSTRPRLAIAVEARMDVGATLGSAEPTR